MRRGRRIESRPENVDVTHIEFHGFKRWCSGIEDGAKQGILLGEVELSSPER